MRFVNQSQIISTFPLDYTNDWSSYLTQLHFLTVCGFHNACPYWYGGFTAFIVEAPGWPLFTYPIYALLGSLTLTGYVSVVLIFLLALFASLKIGAVLKFSKLRSLFFFAFYFGNAIAIGNFIRLGRVSQALAFMLGLWILYIILKYKDKKINTGFLWIIPVYVALIVTHYQEAFLLSFIPLGLLIYKRNMLERIVILLSFGFAAILSLFWTYPFLINVLSPTGGSLLSHIQSNWAFQMNGNLVLTIIASIIVPLAFMIVFLARLRNSKNKAGLIRFYLPTLILSGLFLFRLNVFVPFLKNISPDPVMLFLLLLTMILALELKGSMKLFKVIAIIAIIIIPLASVLVSHIHTPYFTQYTEMENQLLEVLEHTPDNFIMLNEDSRTSYANAYYCLGAVKYGLTTPAGWYPFIASSKRLAELDKIQMYFGDNDCDALVYQLKYLKTDYVIGYADYCGRLDSCGLKTEYTSGQACLLKVV
ncbi:MAG: hypothetical protein V1859_09500 [archaeon]